MADVKYNIDVWTLIDSVVLNYKHRKIEDFREIMSTCSVCNMPENTRKALREIGKQLIKFADDPEETKGNPNDETTNAGSNTAAGTDQQERDRNG